MGEELQFLNWWSGDTCQFSEAVVGVTGVASMRVKVAKPPPSHMAGFSGVLVTPGTQFEHFLIPALATVCFSVCTLK